MISQPLSLAVKGMTSTRIIRILDRKFYRISTNQVYIRVADFRAGIGLKGNILVGATMTD
jgi:hypothetical protein